MAMPDGAMRLEIESDLTLVSAEDALEKIGFTMRDHCWKEPEKYQGNVVLKVASQQYSHAVPLMERIWLPSSTGRSIEISFDYKPDEWSIELRKYTFEEGKVIDNSKILWSPGA